MISRQARAFRAAMPPVARPALWATLVLAVIGLGAFVLVTAWISPVQPIIGPLPDNPLIVWLSFAAAASALFIQGLVAHARTARSMALRVVEPSAPSPRARFVSTGSRTRRSRSWHC
jgi:hypothetical protein